MLSWFQAHSTNLWKASEHRAGVECRTDLAETAACTGEGIQLVAILEVEVPETKKAPDHR